jgi:SSS family solute:Na+ symporter
MSVISGQLFTYIQSVQAYISPPIAAVFLGGILWDRANSRGAVAALVTGFVLGIARLILEMNREDLSGLLLTVVEINFLHFAVLLFALSILALVLGSISGPAPGLEKVQGLTVSRRGRDQDGGLRRVDMIYSSIVLLIMGAVWIYFS